MSDHTDPHPSRLGRTGRVQAACPECANRGTTSITDDPSRREFLRTLAFGAAAVTGAAALGVPSIAGAQGDPTHFTRQDLPGGGTNAPLPSDGPRKLVVLEFPGGLDGLNTVVPYSQGSYYDLRPGLNVPQGEVIDLDGQVGLHPNLLRLGSRGLAIVQGIGTPNPDFSHFEMFDRWWRGDATGANRSMRTGFLGRLCDQVQGDEAVTGVTIGWGPTPALRSERAVTVALPDPEVGQIFSSDESFFVAVRDGLRGLSELVPGAAADHEWLPFAAEGTAQALDFAALIDGLPPPAEGIYDLETDDLLMLQFAVAGRLLSADGGPQVIHIPMDGDFDTHNDQAGRHPGHLERIDAGVDAFLTDLEQRGLSGSTLLATTSEFGRRVADNDSGGADHGAASIAMLAGPVNAGLFGEYPSLDTLDPNGNLIANVSFEEYYALLAAEWMGVPASEVLPGNPTPLSGIV